MRLILTTVFCVLVASSFLNEVVAHEDTELNDPHDLSTENRAANEDLVDELEKELDESKNPAIEEQNDEETELNKEESDVEPASSEIAQTDQGEELEDPLPQPNPRPLFGGRRRRRRRRRRRWIRRVVRTIKKIPKKAQKVKEHIDKWGNVIGAIGALGDEPQNDAVQTQDQEQ